MFSNLSDLRTTIPTIIGAIFAILGATGVLDTETIPMLSEAFTALGLSVLTIVGILAKAK